MRHLTEDKAVLWKPEGLYGISLYKAQVRNFAFNMHSHDEFAIGIIEQGAQNIYYRGKTHLAPFGAIVTINPGEVHNGQPATKQGYQYRSAYISRDILDAVFTGSYSNVLFCSLIHFNDELARHLHSSLERIGESSHISNEIRSDFLKVISEIFDILGTCNQIPCQTQRRVQVIIKACRFINVKAAENITLEEIANEVALSRFHFLRLFKDITGLPPHAYLIQRRVKIAKEAIESGESLIDAAAISGFSDQSHMGRRFKAMYGVSPGQYQKTLSV
ncbi:helix-turn-helix domain-containing protein [Thermodesulfobacteriota bacterium]